MHLYIKRMLVAVLFVIAKKKKKKSPPPPTQKIQTQRERKKRNIHQKQTINYGMFVQRNYI